MSSYASLSAPSARYSGTYLTRGRGLGSKRGNRTMGHLLLVFLIGKHFEHSVHCFPTIHGELVETAVAGFERPRDRKSGARAALAFRALQPKFSTNMKSGSS